MSLSGPGKLLADITRRINARKEESQGEAEDTGCYQPPSPLGAKVDRLVKQRDALCVLCGEMLATLTLLANADKVALLGPTFAEIVEGWQKRWRENNGEV